MPGAGFACRAGDGDDLAVKLAAIPGGEAGQGRDGIGNFDGRDRNRQKKRAFLIL